MSASRQLPKNLDCFIILIMTSLVRYLTHPQVKIDPAVPVLSWGLNDVGRARTEALANTGKLVGVTQVISSGERKAIETAEIIAAKLDIDIEVREAMHENDRSATGFLVPDEFEAVTDQFFMQPFVSIRGWERAIDAQSRVVREVEPVLARNRSGDVIFVGTVPLARFCSVIIPVLRLIEPMRAAVTASHSPKSAVACCILGAASRTCEFPVLGRERRRSVELEQTTSSIV
jgi:hypothetical protein